MPILGFRLSLPCASLRDLEFSVFADKIRRSPFIQKSDPEFGQGTGFYRGAAGFIPVGSPLNFYDFRAHAGQQESARRPHNGKRKLQGPNP